MSQSHCRRHRRLESRPTTTAIAPVKAGFWALTLGSIGVVYGDIGTSPLYALRESVLAAVGAGKRGERAGRARHPVADHLGADPGRHRQIRADPAARRQQRRGRHAGADGAGLARARPRDAAPCILLGIISGALFYGDAIITPALSVLSAVEGLKVATPAFDALRRAAHRRHPGRAVRGAVARHRAGRRLLRPDHADLVRRDRRRRPLAHRRRTRPCCSRSIRGTASSFLLHHGIIGFCTLGAVFLVVTGAEALYADLGHFGRGPIRLAWLVVVLPALLLNYLGQGALVLADPKAIENPFFLLYPRLGAAADGGAGDRRDRDRQPGGDHRRLFAHAAGDPARPAAAPRNPPHLGDAVRADLHAARQHAAADRRAAAGRAVPLVERARLRLRHRRHRHHGGHRHDGVRRHLAGLALAAAGPRRR